MAQIKPFCLRQYTACVDIYTSLYQATNKLILLTVH